MQEIIRLVSDIVLAARDAHPRQKEISTDNRGSREAVATLLLDSGMSFERACRYYRVQANCFKPEKAGNRPLKSLGMSHFSKRILELYQDDERGSVASEQLADPRLTPFAVVPGLKRKPGPASPLAEAIAISPTSKDPPPTWQEGFQEAETELAQRTRRRA
ncbi:MAG: hypothetical protein M3O61_03320 [Gemmatimonadota bacterium]|nr:hypothetical protein [Gemmatimonadota bacterium]